MKISEHISYIEATKSNTALIKKINNVPNEIEFEAMKLVAEKCFEPVRVWYNKPIKINSFFRCKLLNKAVGGSKTSGHVLGNSIDISAGSKTENKKLFDWLKENTNFDQLINEYNYSWVHVSYKRINNRNMVLTIK